MQTASSYTIAQVPTLASIKSSHERFAALGEAPNPLIAERRKSACKDAEIAELRAALEYREREARRLQSRENYVKDMEDTLAQVGKIVGVEKNADKLITAVAHLAATSAQVQNSIEGADAQVMIDANRWRAFLGSARIRLLGTAGIMEPQENRYAHFGMEIWTVYSGDFTESNAHAVERITKYADIAILAQAGANKA